MTSTRTPAPPPPATALGLAGVLGLPLVLVALAVLASAGASPETGGNALPAGAAHRAWVVSVVVALGATAVWWNDRSHPWRWKTHAGVSTAVVAALTLSGVLQLGRGPLRSTWVLVGLLAVVAAVLCGRAGGARFGTLHTGQADTGTWLTVPLRGGGSLVVEPHRAVLRPPTFPIGSVKQAVALSELRLLQPGTLPATGGWGQWGLPGHKALYLFPGPALRLVAGAQQWVLPVADPATLAHVLGGRGSRSTGHPTRLVEPGWSAEQARAGRISTGFRSTGHRRSRPAQNTSRRWAWRGGILAGVSLVLVPISFVVVRSAAELGGLLAILPTTAGGLALVGYGLSIDRRVRPAEDNPLPADAGPWGELRPDLAPVPGWQPWPPPGPAWSGTGYPS